MLLMPSAAIFSARAKLQMTVPLVLVTRLATSRDFHSADIALYVARSCVVSTL